VDKRDGKDYLKAADAPVFASIRKSGQSIPATSAKLENGILTIVFGTSGAQAAIRVQTFDRYFQFDVTSVSGEPDELTLLDAALNLKGKLDDPFACCALALNLKTNVPEVPGPNNRLRASCAKRFGMEGAKVAVIACPADQLRDVMKEVVTAADELPRSNIGGPWAMDADISRGSYLFDFGSITEKTVDVWIELAKSLGLNQIDFHTGHSLRFGDCKPNPDLFPNGRASVKAVIDKLHAAGISAGLHTYAFFMARNTPWITPVPDSRLGKDATFTLAQDIAADAADVPVVETTEKMSVITGFFVRNSVTLQIDDELITYSEISKQAPFAFTKCARGAWGTKSAPHAKGAKVHHIKECFGLFAPDADSTLLAEIAACTADTFNECGFDMIYLDALDGEDILGGSENSWHYGSKFVFEIANRLKKPALFEMSTFHHHLWYVRTRMGAWDHPTRAHKRFIDEHCDANRKGAGMFLPMNLGWWAVQTWGKGNATFQSEPTYPDDIEYLLGKCLGNDMGLALMGVNPDSLKSVPAYQRLAPIFRQYEELRRGKYFPESVKKRLSVPGAEFTLEKAGDKWQFREVQYSKHKVHGMDGWSNAWTVRNRFAEQPVQFRIEALMAAKAYDDPQSLTIEDFGKLDAYSEQGAAGGVTLDMAASTDNVKAGSASAALTLANSGSGAVGAWARKGRRFEPLLNIGDKPALGVWVHGDGQGEVINLQTRAPQHLSFGVSDRYIPVDFTGWRYFELVENEGDRVKDYAWPYANPYLVYREHVDFSKIESLTVWVNNAPPGKKASCCISPIKALPIVSARIKNPKIAIGGKTLTLPVEIESGSYLEFRSMTDCKLYGPGGELLGEVKPVGDVPTLSAGDNAVRFECESPSGLQPRANVMMIAMGDVVK